MRDHPPARRLRISALLAAAALTITACGGDDEPVADPDDPAVEPADVGQPAGTLAPGIPEEYAGAVAPVEVIGDPLPPLGDPATDAAIGAQAPVLVGTDLDGQPIRVDPAADGPTMLVFVAHWCPHCNDEIPKLNQMAEAGQFPDGLNIVAVNTAVAPDRPNWPPVEWLEEDMEWMFPAMLDEIDLEREVFVAADAYGVSGFPFVALVGEDGTVVDRWSGEREPEEILDRIAQLDVA